MLGSYSVDLTDVISLTRPNVLVFKTKDAFSSGRGCLGSGLEGNKKNSSNFQSQNLIGEIIYSFQ